MRPLTYAPHNLDPTGSMGRRSVYWIRFLFHTTANVETVFELPIHLMPFLAVWVIWGGFKVARKGEQTVMTEDTQLA